MRFDRTASADAVVAAIDEAGYAIVEGLGDAATMDRLNADFDPHVDAVMLGRTEFAGHRTKRINNLLAKSTACQELAMNPLVLAVCDHFLLPHCVRYHLHVTGLVELQPGEKTQVLHRDGGIYPVRYPSIPLTVGTIWACNDFSAENGGTNLVPGSHRWEPGREAKLEESVPSVMPRGSALIYTSNFIHGSGENRSNGVRRAMALHYNLGWLRQEENQYLSLPPEAAKALPEALQRLIGYDLGGPYLGFVEEGNPHVLLEHGGERDMARTTPEIDEAARKLKPISMASD